jgi:E3 ubiquitin-protein ligase DOA10
MWFLCIEHEHSRMSFKKNVWSIWIFKILNMVLLTITKNSCNFCTNLWKLNFAQSLYKPMKLGKFVMIVKEIPSKHDEGISQNKDGSS